MPYLFGDTERAARRLQILARVFRPASISFLDDWQSSYGLAPSERDPMVIDLGCGPGCTTRMLADQLDVPVVGLDNSEPFLWEARRLGPSRVSFEWADVTESKLPCTPADMVFARLLLTHLPDVRSALAAWETALRSGGWMLIEDVDSIDTDLPLFQRYLDLVAAALEAGRSRLYVGSSLTQSAGKALAPRIDRVLPHPVTAADAATMFAMNLPAIRQSPHIADILGEDALDAMQEELDVVSATQPSPIAIEWGLRQIAFELQ